MKVRKIPKAIAVLFALAIPLSMTMPTAALAETEPEVVNPRVFIEGIEGNQAEVLSVRNGYSLSDDGMGATVVDLSPVDGKYPFVTGGFTPAFLAQTETNTRQFQFTNTTGSDYTVEDFTAQIVDSEYDGAASAHQLVKAGTSVLAAPQADITVPAGATVPLSFNTADPYAAVIHTNAAGEITGVGATTDFNFTVDGKEYGFQETIGIGSANSSMDVSQTEMALFPTCDFDNTGEPQLTLCATLAGASVSLTALFIDEQAPIIPNDMELEDENGNPVDGTTPVVTAPAIEEPSGEGVTSESSGGWFANVFSLCTNAAFPITLGLFIGLIIVIIVIHLILAYNEVRGLQKFEEFIANDVDNTMTMEQMAKRVNPIGSDRIEEKEATPPFPTITKREKN
jgi:hypothetical protein